MAIQLSPQLEELASQDAAAAGYASVDEYLAHILLDQHAKQQSIIEDIEDIDAKIEAAFASEAKGLDLSPEEAKGALEFRLRHHFTARSVA